MPNTTMFSINLQRAYKLSPQQARILACLSDGKIWPAQKLYANAMQNCPKKAKTPFQKKTIIKIQISRLRARVPDVVIRFCTGAGYYIDAGLKNIQAVHERAVAK